MSAQIFGLRVAGTIFGILSVPQLIRVLFFSHVPVTIAGHEVPVWPNALAAIILIGLCIWLWKLSYGSRT